MAILTTTNRLPRFIGVRELRQNVAEVLRRVQDEGSVTVTVQGRAVAELAPLTEREPSLLTVPQFDALVDATPAEDSRRYELVAGEIVVSPSPSFGHQNLARLLANALEAVAPGRVTTDWTWQVDNLNKVRPDVLVLPRTPSPTDVSTTQVPQIVVEVTSSNRRDDLVTKPSLYAAQGVSQYWLLDTRERTLQIHDLDQTTGTWGPARVLESGKHQIQTPDGEVTIDLAALAPYLS